VGHRRDDGVGTVVLAVEGAETVDHEHRIVGEHATQGIPIAIVDRVPVAGSELVRTMAGHSRRPLMGHAPGCPCAGADECVFARFVALAAEGAREDAVLMAALMVRADLALCLATGAESVGLRLMRGRTPRIVQ